MKENIVIVQAKRTPNGSFLGEISKLSTIDLGTEVVKSVLQNTKQLPSIDMVIMGCVLGAGLGQAPAKQVALRSNIHESANCLTINKVCGSGLESVMLGCAMIQAQEANTVIAGGMESMSNAPYLNMQMRQGNRMGSASLVDHMLHDGLQDKLSNGTLMGIFAEQTAQKYKISRKAQDDFAIHSIEKALAANNKGLFDQEIVPLTIKNKKESKIINRDETLGKVNIEKIPQLKPAFKMDGTITAANASAISDGASAVLLMKESQAKDLGLEILAKIISYSRHSQAPENFTTAPVGAIKKALKKANLSIENVDLFEINEAFAVVTMACCNDLNIPYAKTNVLGGACALGHPIGASGSRILTTLIHGLHSMNKSIGVASLCIGGGEAVAMVVQKA